MDFLTSIGVLLLSGMALGAICKRLCLPSLVLSILITAPIGAFLIDSMHQRLLNKQS